MGPEPSQRQRAMHLVGSTPPPAAELQARAVRARKHRHAARGRGTGGSVLRVGGRGLGRPAARVEQCEERARAPVWRDVPVQLLNTDYRPGLIAELVAATLLVIGSSWLMAEALSTSSCAMLLNRLGGHA